MANVFISYGHEDHAHARRLADALQSVGISVWWDRSLVPGQSFRETVERELNAADAVIVLWSPASVRSDWVLDEAHYAQERKVLLPCVVESVLPPLGFRQSHHVDLSTWNGDINDDCFLSIRSVLARPAPGATQRQNEKTYTGSGVIHRISHWHWVDVPQGSQVHGSMVVTGNRDAVAITVDFDVAGKSVAQWRSGDLRGGPQVLVINERDPYVIQIDVTIFGMSDVILTLRVETPEGHAHGTPLQYHWTRIPLSGTDSLKDSVTVGLVPRR